MRHIPDKPVIIEFPDGSRHHFSQVGKAAFCLGVSRPTLNKHIEDKQWFKCKPVFSSEKTVAKIYLA